MADARTSPQSGKQARDDLFDNADPAVSTAISQIQTFLNAKSDTSRFVGLALLKSLLGNNDFLREDVQTIQQTWQNIPKPFLVRLLKAKTSDKTSEDDAEHMRNLAVAVIHSFICLLLPPERLPSLLDAEEVQHLGVHLLKGLPKLRGTQAVLAWQVLCRIAEMDEKGVLILDEAEYPQEFWGLQMTVVYQEQLLQFFRLYRYSLDDTGQEKMKQWSNLVVVLLQQHKSSPEAVFNMLSDTVSFKASLDHTSLEIWLPTALKILKQQIVSRPTTKVINASISLSASLNQALPKSANFPLRLFLSDSHHEKKFSTVFPNLLLTEIRSLLISLLSMLNEPSYPTLSLHLSRTFDLFNTFIGFLLTASEEVIAKNYDPDFLLRLKSDIPDALSLSIEFLRDRYDGVKGGAPGLHEDGRKQAHRSGPLLLGWDSSTLPISHDPVILAILESIGLSLAEDENNMLVTPALGCIDILEDLFDHSQESQTDDGAIDFRDAVLDLSESLMERVEETKDREELEDEVRTLERALTGMRKKLAPL